MAKTFGLWGAAANAMHAGFTYEGKKTVELHPDAGFMNTHVFLELIGPRPLLEAFFHHLQPYLGENRVTTYAEVEHWGHAAATTSAPHIAENIELDHKAS
jgi:hypothetical protein